MDSTNKRCKVSSVHDTEKYKQADEACCKELNRYLDELVKCRKKQRFAQEIKTRKFYGERLLEYAWEVQEFQRKAMELKDELSALVDTFENIRNASGIELPRLALGVLDIPFNGYTSALVKTMREMENELRSKLLARVPDIPCAPDPPKYYSVRTAFEYLNPGCTFKQFEEDFYNGKDERDKNQEKE